MRKFNKKLNQDITELKTLHMKKDKADFKKRKAEVMKQDNISKATVYREMNKDMPGSYRQPKYSNREREITPQEKEMVKTLMFKKMTYEQICNEMMRLKNESYSWDRFDQIRKEIEKDEKKAKLKGKVEPEPIIIGKAPDELSTLQNESTWGGDVKELIEKLVNYDKIDRDSVITVIIKGRPYKIGTDMIRDFLKKFANSADAEGKSVFDSIEPDLKHLLKEQLRLMKSGMQYSVRDLYEIHKMYKSLGGGSTFNPIDFEVLLAVVQEFAPEATRDDIEDVTSDVAFKHPDCSIYIRPDEVKIRQKVLKTMRENM